MSARLSSRDRRAAIVGATVLGSLAGATRALPAFARWDAAQRASALASVSALADAREARRDLPTLRDSLARLRMRLGALDSTIIVASSPNDAAAQLASILEVAADSARVRTSSLQIRADSTSPLGFARVSVRVVGTSDAVGLIDLLENIEGDDSPLMTVREITVSQPDPVGAPGKPEALHVDVLVETLAIIRRNGQPT